MKLFVPTALALCLSVASAQTPQFTDPANLRGERVQPRDGRELPIDQGALGLEQLLRKLNTRASVMNIVAHPDDEDGGMLTLYSRGLGARVADLSLNRGEGGQNAMTGDFEDALGLLRTQELLASDRYTGVDQFFGTEVDFGFSKTKQEAFAKWGHDRVLYDVVRAIRLYRPLVLTSTWIGGVTDGHGQHQAAGQIAQEAFVAAGDPKVFPELTAEGILPWQPLRIYARVPMQSISPKGLFDYATGQYTPARFTNYVTGEVTTTVPSADVIVHEGTPDALLGAATGGTAKSYVQFARLGLAQQRSQVNPSDRRAPAGVFDVAYHLYGSKLPISNERESSHSRVPQGFSLGSHSLRKDVGFSPWGMPSADADPDFFTGIDTSLESIATLAPNAPPFLSYQLGVLAKKLQTATSNFDPQDISKSAPALRDALQTCDALIGLMASIVMDNKEKVSVLHELRIKRVQLNDALVLALGASLTAVVSDLDDVHSKVSDIRYSDREVGQKTLIHTELKVNKSLSIHEIASTLTLNDNSLPCNACVKHAPKQKQIIMVPLDAQITRPYFSRDNIEQPVYTHVRPSLRDAPTTPDPLVATRVIDYGATHLILAAKVEGYSQSGLTNVDEVLQPVAIVPLAKMAFDLDARVLSTSATSLTLTLSKVSGREGIIHLGPPLGWSSEVASELAMGRLRAKTFTVTPPHIFTSVAVVKAHLDGLGVRDIEEGYRSIRYGGLPGTNYYTPAETRIVPVDLKLPTRHNIAYLPGTGDAIPEALTSIGLTPTILTIADLTPDKLKPYDTVILGVRTYAAHPDLHGAPTQALLDYARKGGNVVVQYQTPEFIAADAPYPLSLSSNEKVVDETAPVALLEPASTLLTTPNVLTRADFDHWVEERGHGFLSTWDAHYTALTETHDPGSEAENVAPQSPQRGGLITTALGKGRWTYVAFALYRQLPEAVPGAFRLFVNLINP